MEDKISVHQVLSLINKSWLNGKPEEMNVHLNPDITMRPPGFSHNITGSSVFISSFIDFCKNSKVIEFTENDEVIDLVGNCAIATYNFEMIYETKSYRAKSKGRDFWIFEKTENSWKAVWRTMMDLEETRLL